tara:strand:+ start:550 stop:756 length:207 start_codon:yes stop_codon:yes gene_type:complete
MNLVQFLKSIAKDPEAWEKKQVENANKNKVRFNIGGQSGFKWKTESSNKTWIEDGKIVRDRKGKTITK